ncbi:MAG: phage major tail protein phi13 family [Bacillales bacterium]|jgi:phi13 family phage major tail protein|nr:phage major tail protein phi13 family [Bacillales bacterium]
MPVQVGLSDLYYAILTKDDSTGVNYQGPVKVIGAINAKISPKSSIDTLYADDGASETMTTLGEIEVEFEAKDLPFSHQAALLGHAVSNGMLVKKATDSAPYVALGFRSKKSNGKYRFVWLYKGKFQLPEREHKTMEDKPTYQTAKIKGIFVKRDFDQAWEINGDEDEAGFTGASTWFNNVVSVTADTTPPTVTTVPVDAATTVAVGANVVFTFSEHIQEQAVNNANFMLFKATDGTLVASNLSIDATRTIVTLDPTANLTAATAYIAVATTNVKDLSGNALAQNCVVNFTTA